MASCMKCKRTGFGFLEIKSGLCPSCRRSLEVAEEAKTREQRQRTKAETDQINSKIDAIVLTTETAPNLNITKRIDIISAQAAFEINNFKDLFVGFMNPVRGRSNELERQLEELRVQSSQKLKAKAYELGANGIVAVDLDLSTVTIGGISMMMMMASGTAVVIEDWHDDWQSQLLNWRRLDVTEQQTITLDKVSYQLEFTWPVWLPYNDTAHDIVASLVTQIDFTTENQLAAIRSGLSLPAY